jgi:hypothetical protein
MTRIARSLSTHATLCLLVATTACGPDVGDSSAGPGLADGTIADVAGDDGPMLGVDAGADVKGDGSDSGAGPGGDSAQDAGSQVDAGGDQAAQPETGVGMPDEGTVDAAMDQAEALGPEASTPDATMPDATDADAAGADSGGDATVDAGMADGNTLDTGSQDAQSVDAGSDASPDGGEGGKDAAPSEGGGMDAGPLVPCTMPGQTNCVQCDGNSKHGNICTGTEALIVQRDIAKGFLMGHVPDPTSSCYECLVVSRCIDSDLPKMGVECEDLTGTVGAGAQATETKSQACLNTLACLLSTNCGNAPISAMAPSPNDGVGNCYCGVAFPTNSSCAGGAGADLNGACRDVELDGFGDTTSTSPAMVLSSFTTKTSGAGVANAILKCAGTNTGIPACPMCYQ